MDRHRLVVSSRWRLVRRAVNRYRPGCERAGASASVTAAVHRPWRIDHPAGRWLSAARTRDNSLPGSAKSAPSHGNQERAAAAPAAGRCARPAFSL